MKAGLVLRAQLKSGDAGEIRQSGVKLPVAVERLLGEREECGRFNGNRFRRGGASSNRVAGTARPRQKQSGKRKKGKKNKLLHCRRRLPWNLKESASMVSFHNISPVRHFFNRQTGDRRDSGKPTAVSLPEETRIDLAAERLEEFIGHRLNLIETELRLRVRVGGNRVEDRPTVAIERPLRPHELNVDHAAIEAATPSGHGSSH